jgi:uroporphyrin-III C-methyltransferase
MDLVALGLSLRSGSLPGLETLPADARLARAEERMRALPGVRESVRLATGDRALLLLGVSYPLRNAPSDPEAGSAAAASHRHVGPAHTLEDARLILAEEAGIADEDRNRVTALAGADAFGHVVRLVCGLESPVAEDTDLLDRLRAAYAEAVERGAAGRILGGAMHRVFRAARRIGARQAGPASRPSALRPEAMVEEETRRWVEWMRERGAARRLVRLGRMLEVPAASSGNAPAVTGRADGSRESFRVALLKAFTAMAAEARDEDEASAQLALFEEALRRAGTAEAEDPVRRDARAARRPAAGTVSLVGAGPGAGGLLTLEGARRLAEADVVYHDALSGDEVLAHCRPGARLVPVGKRRGRASATQTEIEAALVRDAKAGLAVVRLKGGDPFVFGRGGEEGLALSRAGVPFTVVPGVSSGIAAPALAGIPLTHRGIASSAAFVTAHDLAEGPQGEARRARLAHLARGAETLVVFMAGAEIPRVRRTLLEAGLDAATPAALIESGASADQKVAIGTLDGLETLAEGLTGGPALVVVGRTVDLAQVLEQGNRWTAQAAGRLATKAPAAPETTVTEMSPGRARHDRRRAG